MNQTLFCSYFLLSLIVPKDLFSTRHGVLQLGKAFRLSGRSALNGTPLYRYLFLFLLLFVIRIRYLGDLSATGGVQ